MLKALFDKQKNHLSYFFDHLDIQQVEKVVKKLLECQGALIFCGVGKSGHIAEKVAAMFLSIGQRAFALSISNALHGDIGFLRKGDLFFVFSKSGSTSELVKLLPYVQKKQAFVIAITSSGDSPLAKMADLSLTLPMEKEICPFDLAPTTSSAIQLIFGDCLAVAFMEAKKVPLTRFALNHPGGLLGARISYKVRDLMLQGEALPTCRAEDNLLGCLHELSSKKCGCLLVVDKKRSLQGIFTDGDLRRAIEAKGPKVLETPMGQLMTKDPKSISSEALAHLAMQKMEEDPNQCITVLPVLSGGRLIGLIRMHDVLQKELS